MVRHRFSAQASHVRSAVLFTSALVLAGLSIGGGCFQEPDDGLPPSGGSVEVDPRPSGLDAHWVLHQGPYGLNSPILVAGAGSAVVSCSDGEYTIRWLPEAGYSEPVPNPDTGEVSGGSELHFIGMYTALPGRVIVDAEPDDLDAPWVLSGPGGFEHSGSGDMEFNGVEQGEYVVDWGDVDGYVTPSPDPASGTLAPDGQLILLGTYVSE